MNETKPVRHQIRFEKAKDDFHYAPEESPGGQLYEKNNQIVGKLILPQSVRPKKENGKIIGEQVNLGVTRLIAVAINPVNNQQVVLRGTNPVVYRAGNAEVSLEFADARVVQETIRQLKIAREEAEARTKDFWRAVKSGEMRHTEEEIANLEEKVDHRRQAAQLTEEGPKIPLFSRVAEYVLHKEARYEFFIPKGERKEDSITYASIRLKPPLKIAEALSFKIAENIGLSHAYNHPVRLPPDLVLSLEGEFKTKDGISFTITGGFSLDEQAIEELINTLERVKDNLNAVNKN